MVTSKFPSFRKFPCFRNFQHVHPTASWAFLLWPTHEKEAFGYPFPKHLQFRFRTTNWSKVRGESQRVSDEPLQAPKYEEVYYTFTTCNNTELWTPQGVSAVLASRVPYDSTAEVNNTQFLGDNARDKPQFGSSARWAEWVTSLTRGRKEPGPGNNISSYWRPDETEAKAIVSPAPCQCCLKNTKPSVAHSVGSPSPFSHWSCELYRNFMVRNHSTLLNTGPVIPAPASQAAELLCTEMFWLQKSVW